MSDLEPRFRDLLQDLALVTRAIRKATPDIRSLVLSSNRFLPRLEKWWRQTAPELKALLDHGIPVSDMAAHHLRGLHHWLDWAPAQADVMAGSTRDGSGRVVLVPEILANCIYRPNHQRDIHDLAPRDPPVDVHCTDPPAGTQQRGSARVPDQG